MKILDFLEEKQWTIKDLADKLECSRPYMSRVIHGHHKPSAKFVRHLIKLTKGKVTEKEISL